jgi:hypothetical protein
MMDVNTQTGFNFTGDVNDASAQTTMFNNNITTQTRFSNDITTQTFFNNDSSAQTINTSDSLDLFTNTDIITQTLAIPNIAANNNDNIVDLFGSTVESPTAHLFNDDYNVLETLLAQNTHTQQLLDRIKSLESRVKELEGEIAQRERKEVIEEKEEGDFMSFLF